MDDRRGPPQSETQVAAQPEPGCGRVFFPRDIAALLDSPFDSPADSVWDAFLTAFGDILLRTATYAYRGHDRSMDAYAFILENLRQNDYQRLRAFPGGDRTALSRWLVVVARRLCTDLRRQRYGRVRPSTPELDRDTRRRLVDEIWDPREPSDLPAPTKSNPEWELRYGERRRALESAVGELEPKDQLLLALRFEDDLSAQRISGLMGFPTPFHVYRRLNRVLTDLRKGLEGMGISEPNP